MAASDNRFARLLQILTDHGVEFIVVGGVAAILEGAPVTTFDLDVLFEKSPENIRRLLAALGEINARYNDPADRHILPDAARLETMKLHLLTTDLGALDVLSRVGNDLSYADLLPRSHEHRILDSRVRVLNVEAIIEAASRPKDQLALPFLRQILTLRHGE